MKNNKIAIIAIVLIALIAVAVSGCTTKTKSTTNAIYKGGIYQQRHNLVPF